MVKKLPPKQELGLASCVLTSSGLSLHLFLNLQLADHIVRLRGELDREREERKGFELEREKVQAFWEISKRKLEEAKTELRRRQKEREETQERRREEISVSYPHKHKHRVL